MLRRAPVPCSHRSRQRKARPHPRERATISVLVGRAAADGCEGYLFERRGGQLRGGPFGIRSLKHVFPRRVGSIDSPAMRADAVADIEHPRARH